MCSVLHLMRILLQQLLRTHGGVTGPIGEERLEGWGVIHNCLSNKCVGKGEFKHWLHCRIYTPYAPSSSNSAYSENAKQMGREGAWKIKKSIISSDMIWHVMIKSSILPVSGKVLLPAVSGKRKEKGVIKRFTQEVTWILETTGALKLMATPLRRCYH